MRILVLIHEYPPVGGGGGRVAQDVCRGLVQRGHEINVLTAHWGDLPRQEMDEGVVVHRLPSGRKQPFRAGLPAMVGYVLAALSTGLSLARRWKPDIIHVHFAVPSGAAAWVLSLLTGIPYVLTAHLGDVPGGVPEKTSGWFRWIFPLTPPIWQQARRVTAVSDFTRRLALAKYNVKVSVIPNGVDLARLNPGEIKLQNPPRIVFAGRFVSQKNPLQVVQTLANIQDLPWRCVMVGDGPMRSEIEQAIQFYSLADRISLTGWLQPEEVLAWFRRSDILFMPSLSEGLPVVGVQAMSFGLALVLSRIGGCLELVEPGRNGHLFNPGDTQGFVGALRSLLTRPADLLAMRCTSRQLAEKYNLSKVVAAYEETLLNSL